jgi:hypothetical protein
MRPRHVPDSDLGVFPKGVSPGRKLAKPQALPFPWALPGDGEAAPECGLNLDREVDGVARRVSPCWGLPFLVVHDGARSDLATPETLDEVVDVEVSNSVDHLADERASLSLVGPSDAF